MRRPGRKAKPICLTEQQRGELMRLSHRRRAYGPSLRARVILMLADGPVGREVERKLRVCNATRLRRAWIHPNRQGAR